jgi:hypothetical protein
VDTPLFESVNSRKSYNLLESKINKLNSHYRFKDILIQPPFPSTDTNIPLWVSMGRSFDLAFKYEIIHGVRYDVVVKLRPDIIFDPRSNGIEQDIENIIDQCLQCTNLHLDWNMSTKFIDDVAYFGNHSVMSTLREFCLEGKKEYYFLPKFLESRNIQLKPAHSHRYSILREHLLHLDPIIDYEQIQYETVLSYYTKEHGERSIQSDKMQNYLNRTPKLNYFK